MRHARIIPAAVICLLALSIVAASSKEKQKVQNGLWGGNHISMEITDSGAKIEYDCAHGTIDQPVMVNRKGKFNLAGSHTRETGGPVRSDAEPNTRPARFTGRVAGNSIRLTVTLTDTGETLGVFSLTLGEEPQVFKCK